VVHNEHHLSYQKAQAEKLKRSSRAQNKIIMSEDLVMDGADSAGSDLREPRDESGGLGKITRNRFGHIRTVWRMLIYLGMVIVAGLPVVGLLAAFGSVLPKETGGENIASVINIVFMVGVDIALVLGAWITLRWIDRRPFFLLGMSLSLRSIKELLAGLAFGVLYLTGIVLVLWSLGFVEVTAAQLNLRVIQSGLTYLAVFAAAGILEELANRGYLLQALIEGTRVWIAILGFSLIFSLGHIFNEDMSYVSAGCLFIQGILLSSVYFKTRSLWVPIGIHIAWNWTQGPLWGIRVSGTEIPNTLLMSVPKGTELLSGGNFGIEGSLITVIITLVLLLYIWKARWIRPSEEMAALWRRYPSGFGLPPASEPDDGLPSSHS
jgi:membrane protease YdiL (CAAX protease family)